MRCFWISVTQWPRVQQWVGIQPPFPIQVLPPRIMGSITMVSSTGAATHIQEHIHTIHRLAITRSSTSITIWGQLLTTSLRIHYCRVQHITNMQVKECRVSEGSIILRLTITWRRWGQVSLSIKQCYSTMQCMKEKTLPKKCSILVRTRIHRQALEWRLQSLKESSTRLTLL